MHRQLRWRRRPDNPTHSSTPTTPAPAPKRHFRRDSRLDKAADQLHGDLVRPGDPGYDRAQGCSTPRYDHVRPRAVVYCRPRASVATTVTFARDAGLPLALRSGGHSYAGWTTGNGLVLDVSRISGVRVSGARQPRSAPVPADRRLRGVAGRGRRCPAGSCPTVGVAGLTLGGGMGVLSGPGA